MPMPRYGLVLSLSQASMVRALGAAQASKAQPVRLPGVFWGGAVAASEKASGHPPRAEAAITAMPRRRRLARRRRIFPVRSSLACKGVATGVVGDGIWVLLD